MRLASARPTTPASCVRIAVRPAFRARAALLATATTRGTTVYLPSCATVSTATTTTAATRLASPAPSTASPAQTALPASPVLPLAA